MSQRHDTADAAQDLLSAVTLGALELPNRVLMAPMTRNRAGDGRVPTDLQATYYRQRAGAGLIVTEATVVSPQGVGYVDTPGIYDDDQVAGWRRVTDAVHDAGGRIVLQLWHVGRVSHTSFHDGEPPVSSTDAPADAQVFTASGFTEASAPRPLDEDEIPGVVEDFAAAARRARDAGFDGVEVHGANGYLLEQFLASAVNDRNDGYGGSIEDRARLLVEVVEAVCDAWEPGRVGLRLSLGNGTAGADDDLPVATLTYVAERLDGLGLAYLHLVESGDFDRGEAGDARAAAIRAATDTPLVVNGGYDRERGARAVAEGRADAVAFGRPYIANPDLVERFRRGAPLNDWDQDTFYGGGAEGYVDYPTLDDLDDVDDVGDREEQAA